jgi:hypothetical protein
MAGVYAPANGEFSTGTFEMPTEPLWLDAEVKWQGGNHVGVPEGSDEGRQASMNRHSYPHPCFTYQRRRFP